MARAHEPLQAAIRRLKGRLTSAIGWFKPEYGTDAKMTAHHRCSWLLHQQLDPRQRHTNNYEAFCGLNSDDLVPPPSRWRPLLSSPPAKKKTLLRETGQSRLSEGQLPSCEFFLARTCGKRTETEKVTLRRFQSETVPIPMRSVVRASQSQDLYLETPGICFFISFRSLNPVSVFKDVQWQWRQSM